MKILIKKKKNKQAFYIPGVQYDGLKKKKKAVDNLLWFGWVLFFNLKINGQESYLEGLCLATMARVRSWRRFKIKMDPSKHLIQIILTLCSIYKISQIWAKQPSS